MVLLDALDTYSCKIKHNKLKKLYLQYQSAYGHQLGIIVTYFDEHLPIKSPHVRDQHLVKSRDELKTLYLHYYSAYGHQTWQDGFLWSSYP